MPERPAFYADCPARLAVELLADKWAVVTLHALSEGPVRHGDLRAQIGVASAKVLTQTLRRLQANGLVERRVFAEAPPRVEYGLTPLGRSLQAPIGSLNDWARTYGPAVVEFQQSTSDDQAASHAE